MTVDHTRDVKTHDISKIDLAVDAASFLILMQTYLGKNNTKTPETRSGKVFLCNITNNNNYVITNSSIPYIKKYKRALWFKTCRLKCCRQVLNYNVHCIHYTS